MDVKTHKFYRISYRVDDVHLHTMNLTYWRLPLDKTVPEGVALLLQAEMACEPEEVIQSGKM